MSSKAVKNVKNETEVVKVVPKKKIVRQIPPPSPKKLVRKLHPITAVLLDHVTALGGKEDHDHRSTVSIQKA